ncbi:2-deoxy-scyllo-inosose synthase [Desulfosporosinus fructosivorans]|nr:2-deoxy-scyllo-inosose synthase [Desulfosporosinus fructosivorans]
MTKEIKMIDFKTHLIPDPTFYFGNRITHELGSLINRYDYDKVYFVTNELLLKLYGKDILDMFNLNAITHEVVILTDGEDHKNFRNLEYLCETLIEKNISKGSIILGFGGGCLTNIVGLAAGLIFRGIRYIEIPTTLMGITDSTLSNKQAINGKYGKNQFGMYYAPIFIFGDTQYLKTESIAGKKSAIVEGIKNGFISNKRLLEYFETKLEEDIENYSEEKLNELALKIIQSKLKILERDPSEKGYCMTLEYGHTFGHAMEFFTKGGITHGLAVAKGMCIAAELSHHLGYIPKSLLDRHYYLVSEKLGLDVSIPDYISVENIMQAGLADNKKTARGIQYVLLNEIGECLNPDGNFQISVDPEVVRKVLTDYKKKTINSNVAEAV